MIEELTKYSGHLAKIDGPARSGKTEILVRRCVNLLERGVKGESILVVVSSEFAGMRFRQRLMSALAASPNETPSEISEQDSSTNLLEQASRIVVSPALDVCVSMLDDPVARTETGRVPRILNEGEYPFFIEDLKTLGQKNQRLHNMLQFFYAQWSEFKDEKEWIIPGEESSVLDHARDILGAYKAMLRHEAPYLCGKFLLSEAGRSFTQRYDYVFCDDFQNLSRAEQICMCLCARKQVMICGNTLNVTKVNTAYPSAKGFERFEHLRKNVDVFTLNKTYGIKQAVGAKPLFLEWDTPEDELAGLGSLIRSYCESDPEANPSDIVIAVPNKQWGRVVQSALKNQEIKASSAGLTPGLGGDPRTPGRHDALSAYVKLSLVADSQDLIAWRAWTGFDNMLTNSEAWSALHKAAQKNSVSLYDALVNAVENDGADSATILKKSALKQAWHSGQAVIDQCRNLQGIELAQTLGMTEVPLFSEMLDALSGDEDAVALCELVRTRLARFRFPQNTDLVHLALYENLCGLDYNCLIVPGMVDGIIPFRDAFDDAKGDDKRKLVLDEDRRRLSSCISIGTSFLIASTFMQADIETAERMKMKVARVASVKGRRVALLSRSTFLDETSSTTCSQEADNTCPDFISGTKEDIEHFFKRD